MQNLVSTPFLKKLRREATANPKKAGLLGLLLLVAVYFWAPLLRQWTRSAENAPDTSAAAPPAAATSAPPGGAVAPPLAAATPVEALTPSAPTAAASATPRFHWKQLVAAIESDPRMRPVEPPAELAAQRDPFIDPRPPAVAEAAPEVAGERSEDVTPGELGLVLSSTIIGHQRRTALVNGKVYAAGRELEARDGVVFVVRDIEPWGIVLERAGKRFELELPRPSGAAH